ncbi:nuclear factor of activated T-cells 5-like protein [Leptotrombidium deliense]|uniref:Nuclear factor of activated T-cells 5-like protein n=1 Tax=Leptotrombidium deliense TaxID=299467 RepID=A0A443SQP6_9ACAR|nr:nuclear factor of activated T-cells 5-like protein [Leptotrombidium deliense]
MGKFGERSTNCRVKSTRPTLISITPDIDDDSGFCGSNLSPPITKIPRLENDPLILKSFINDIDDHDRCFIDSQVLQFQMESCEKLAGNYPAKSRSGKFELRIISQPEEQHRARYLTEGSRGSIKDRSGTGHPVVKLFGYSESTVRLQCFIGHDKHIGTPHLFYQASKITGKNSTRCHTSKVDGTTVISLDLHPEHNMEAVIDCIGILKERNVDVEQKLLRLKAKNSNSKDPISLPNKKRSTRCRLIFRCKIPSSNETLQVVSNPILCTQPLGTPEISKISTTECDISGNKELFIIGKNFLKDTKVIFKAENENWMKTVEPDKEFLHSVSKSINVDRIKPKLHFVELYLALYKTHLVCTIPAFEGAVPVDRSTVETTLTVRSGGKYSEIHPFVYTTIAKVNFMAPNAPIPSTLATPVNPINNLSAVDQMQSNYSPECSTFYICPRTTVSESVALADAAATVETAALSMNDDVSKHVTLSASATASASVGVSPATTEPVSIPVTPPVALNQGSPLSEMSQMTDNELLRLINPSTFEECKEAVESYENISYYNHAQKFQVEMQFEHNSIE